MKELFNCSNCLSMQYGLLKDMYFDDIDETDNYVLCTSKIMDDCFWNLAYLKTRTDINIINEIENRLKSMNRMPVLYIGRDDIFYEEKKKIILDNNYRVEDTDVFMLLNDYKDINRDIEVKVVETVKEYNDFMKVLSSAYNDNIESSSENVYAGVVSKCYYDAIKKSIKSNKTYHIIGYNEDNIPVSVATLNIANGIGLINNVGTAQGFWNKGYSKQVLSYLIKLFKEKGGKDLLLCTEYQSKNQTYYEKLGFKEIYVMEQYVK